MEKKDLTAELKKLQPIVPGMKFSDVLTAEFLNAIIYVLWALSRGDNILSGENIRRKIGSSWIMLSADSGNIYNPVAYQPFQLVDGNDSGTNFIRVVYSTLVGVAPDGFSPGDDPIYKFSSVSGDGFVWAEVDIDGTTGEVTGRSLDFGSTVPTDTDTSYYVEIGSYTTDMQNNLSVVNARYGPITAQICQDFFSPTLSWSVSFN